MQLYIIRILFRSFWGCDDISVRGRSTSNYHRPFARRRRFLEPARADWWVGLKGLTLLTMNDQNQYEEVMATVPNGGQSNTFLKFWRVFHIRSHVINGFNTRQEIALSYVSGWLECPSENMLPFWWESLHSGSPGRMGSDGRDKREVGWEMGRIWFVEMKKNNQRIYYMLKYWKLFRLVFEKLRSIL